MSMYGLDVPFYDYGFSDPAITRSLFGNPLSPSIEAVIDYEDDDFDTRRRPPRPRPRPRLPTKNPSSPTKHQHRHDGTSPLPLGMDWSPPPRLWDGRDSVWPHEARTGWSYCVTIPSWAIVPSAGASDTVVFFRVQVGVQSPEGITTTRGVLRRFNEFLNLYSELRKEFPKRSFPPAPPRRLMKMRSRTLLEERRCALEEWVGKLLSDIDVSRTAQVAIFLELEAAARSSFYESNQNESDVNSSVNVVDGLREEFAEGNHEILNQHNMLSKGDNNAMNCDDENLEQTSMTERERFTRMQWDMEVLQRKCMDLELKLTTEQDARVNAESMKASTIEQNEMLLKELDDAKEEVKNLRKQHDEFTSLRASHSELKQELSRCFEEKLALEKEKRKWEVGKASKVKLLHKCEVICRRLRECSVNLLVEEEDKLIVDTSSPSDAIDLLAKSDTQIGLLLAEAEVLAEDVEAANDDDDELRLRRMLADIIIEDAKLRKQANSLIRRDLDTP